MSLSVLDRAHMLRCADRAIGFDANSLIFGFTPVGQGKSLASAEGPETNRGQKGRVAGFSIGIDWLTVSIPLARLEECGSTDLDYLAKFLLGSQCLIKVMRPSGRGANFYENSCVMLDREGELCGHVYFGGNLDTLMFDLTGTGCRWVKDWAWVRRQLEIVCARITRCDVALDDFYGQLFDVRQMNDLACLKAFAGEGRTPSSRFIDDHGFGTGCTLYVGRKGHKQLRIYDKGKEQKDITSPWVRVEQGFYGKHYRDATTGEEAKRGGLPYEMLTAPMRYLRGAHQILAQMTDLIHLDDVTEALHVVKAKVEATATAMVRWLKNQVGPSIGLLYQVLGDEADGFMRKQVTREVRPSRFKGLGAADELIPLLRGQLCHAST